MIKDKNKEMIRFITDKLVTYLSKFTQDRIYLDDNTIIVYTDDNDTVPYLMFLIKDTDAINDEETIDLYKSNGTKELNIVYNNAIHQYNLKLVDIASELDKVNLNELTPIDALNILAKMKEKMQ